MKFDRLLKFRRPAQYMGGEFLSVKKVWSKTVKKFLLVSPFTYEMSASSLGGRIIYHIINSKNDCLCERTFMPEEDFKAHLLKNDLALFSLESRRAAFDFDVVGIMLSSRNSFLELNDLFKLLKIPMKNRGKNCPAVIAGGPSVSNFAPIENFFDAFLVGDAEESLPRALDFYEKGRKEIFLEKIAKIDGFFVPGVSESVTKAVCRLDSADYPRAPAIPNIRTLMNRLDIEVMRGCPNNCAFCEAKRFYSPLRIRPADEVKEIIFSSLKKTGYDGISLSSLSVSQYPHLTDVIDGIIPFLRRKGTSLHVPSLRPDRRSVECVMKILELNQPNLTFAPESFSPRLQEAINKKTSFEEFYGILTDFKKAGFRDVKIYLMLGLPGETDEDVKETLKAVKLFRKSQLKITLAVSFFVPAPHTLFERAKFVDPEVFTERLNMLRSEIKGMPLRTPDMEGVVIESVIARGGGEISPVLEGLAGGQEFSPDLWNKKAAAAGINTLEYAMRDLTSGHLPWSKIKLQTVEKNGTDST